MFRGRIMFLKGVAVVVLFFISLSSLWSQTNSGGDGETRKLNDINVDGKILMGNHGYQNMACSLIHGLRDFTYQINTEFEQLDGFDNLNYSGRNSGYAECTAEINVNDYWKIIPQFEGGNKTLGMFDNSAYSCEKRNFIGGRLRNEYKPAPARWSFDLFCLNYNEELVEKTTGTGSAENFTKSGYQLNMEYIWSASNKVGVSLNGEYVDYDEEYEDDYSYSSEFYGTFKITEFIMLTVSPKILINKDKTDYLYFRGGASTVGIKYLSLEINYQYDNRSYDPALFLNENRYARIRYDVDPSVVHRTEVKCNFQVNNAISGFFNLENLGITLHSFFEKNDNYYNYDLDGDNLVYIEEMPANLLNGGADFVTKFSIATHKFGIEVAYNFYRYLKDESESERNITYKPEHTLKASVVYENRFFEISLENLFRTEVYERIDSNEKLESKLEGVLSFYVKVSESLHLYGKVDNLYDETLLYRYGYPEQGRFYSAGLRIAL